jgi:malate dehydrogenase (oxaloacetate-decarboxylating)
LAAVNVTRQPIRDQRIAIVGAGSAGIGIANLLLRVMIDAGVPAAEARRRFYAIDRDGLLVEGMPGVVDFQLPFAQSPAAVANWRRADGNAIGLADVVANAKPTVLIGVSGQPGIFAENIIRDMASAVARPIIFPLSNPTSRSEATPQDLLAWTEGRAVIGTGSPFPPVVRDGRSSAVDQTNNAYVFPGIGLGVLGVKARRVTDGMFVAAAKVLADVSPAGRDAHAPLLPPVARLREVAFAVAKAVAREARAERQCEPFEDGELDGLIVRKMWSPVYRPYRRSPHPAR